MKYLLFTLAFCTTIYAQTMSDSEHLDLHTESAKQTDKTQLHQMHKIDENKAMKIAQKQCKEDNIKLTLKHHKKYLYYLGTTTDCKVYINALNGKILTPEEIKKK
ncbi:PepSY domain-containing protein [Sulfurovum sp. NBC37-1]|uniref:PepSY domain-containing protein n=1 Tax=Sulfurovum sp. (strain NBC37-1) TaxID=387093 RepID=UPI0001587909|nr:PepSY domain-containing protein [Sulfurovum sp. NBC37-1]BAF71736.1 hypothetical protein SUN_0778 [Sulfurovum sp. NBC37-1]